MHGTKLISYDWFKDSLDLIIIWNCEIQNMELWGESHWNFSSTTSWFSHCCQKLKVFNYVWSQFLSVIPKSIVHPLPNEFKGRLSSICFFSRHVEIINKANTLSLGIFRLPLVLGSLFKVAFNDFLDLDCACLGRKVNWKAWYLKFKSKDNVLD